VSNFTVSGSKEALCISRTGDIGASLGWANDVNAIYIAPSVRFPTRRRPPTVTQVAELFCAAGTMQQLPEAECASRQGRERNAPQNHSVLDRRRAAKRRFRTKRYGKLSLCPGAYRSSELSIPCAVPGLSQCWRFVPGLQAHPPAVQVKRRNSVNAFRSFSVNGRGESIGDASAHWQTQVKRRHTKCDVDANLSAD
jgi:hypothetical protein